MKKDDIIKIFESTEALLSGHFVLTSGRHSASYFQCAKVLQHPEYLTLFALEIADYYEMENVDVVLSPAVGGIVLGTEVGRQLGARTIFTERKDGKMVLRRGFHIEKNERILVVEDVVTTGGSVKEAIKAAENEGGIVIGAGILVDRSNGKAKIHSNQYAITTLESESYSSDNIPDELAIIPIQKPGSRHIV
ncbi:MAG: orotate phosphoribosyltransferase [Candidatus Marinimicrobia bacterium]|nr:orotate phosphoribosyltransferase [Candidatus Neomarinimicrobiota bacterium]